MPLNTWKWKTKNRVVYCGVINQSRKLVSFIAAMVYQLDVNPRLILRHDEPKLSGHATVHQVWQAGNDWLQKRRAGLGVGRATQCPPRQSLATSSDVDLDCFTKSRIPEKNIKKTNQTTQKTYCISKCSEKCCCRIVAGDWHLCLCFFCGVASCVWNAKVDVYWTNAKVSSLFSDCHPFRLWTFRSTWNGMRNRLTAGLRSVSTFGRQVWSIHQNSRSILFQVKP